MISPKATVSLRVRAHRLRVESSIVSVAPAGELVGVSDWARRTRAEILRISPHASNVLVTGPTGTGKELIARALHDLSPRSVRRFVAVDCAAVAGTLFASHIFGHRKGAFTGADQEALGCFRAADRGTIFLDEIGELDIELQAKLLRVLQQRVVVPVGGHEEIPVDVRVIAATNRDLPAMISAGRFREDLYYRLHVASLATKPLKDRPEDIEPLAHHFLKRLAARAGLPVYHLAPGAVERLRAYDWPGNVRQLENCLERAVLYGHADPLDENVILEMLSDQPGFAPAISLLGLPDIPPEAEWPSMAEMERAHIERTLQRTGYNQAAAARLLKLNRSVLVRKIKQHKIDVTRSKPGRPSK